MRMIKNVYKRVLVVGLTMALLTTSLCAIGANATQQQDQEARAQELQVAVLSEPRLYPQSLISHSSAFSEAVGSDIAMLSESQAILDAAIDEIIQKSPDVLLVPGDLTREGEVDAHEHLARRLNYLRTELPEINIYVINGRRDINNPNARSFASGTPVSVGSASPELFRSIYNGLGYNDATSVYFVPTTRQEGGNSYVARPAPGFTVIAIDTASGAIGSELLGWITEQTKIANSRGDTVFAFMHHSLVPHSSLQETMFSDTLLDNYEYIGARFLELGIRYVFTSAMRANNIAQLTAHGNTLTDISTASLTAYPSPIRFATFTRGVDEENRRTETVEISTEFLQSINYIDPRTGQNISDLAEYGSRMISPDILVSIILDSGLHDTIHSLLDEIEATEFVNTRGVRHTGLRAFIESNLPVEDEYGNTLSNDLGDFFIDLLEETLPANEAEGMNLGGIGTLWVESHQNRIRVRLLGGFAGNVFMTYNNIRNHLVNPGMAQLNNNLLLDRRIVNETIVQLGHDILNMNVYPLHVPDGDGGYTSAGNQYTLFDLIKNAYLSHLAGDEQSEQWMLDVIDNLNSGGSLANDMVDLVLTNLGVTLDKVLHTVTVNTSAIVTSDLLGAPGRLAVITFLGNNLGSIMNGFGFCAVELMEDLGEMLPEDMLTEVATMLTDTFSSLLVNYGYPNDNFTTLYWIGSEIDMNVPVDKMFLRAIIVEAEGLHQEEFTPETWEIFNAALSAARGVYDDVDATQGQVDEALFGLRTAINNLELIIIIVPVDRAALRVLIGEVEGLNQEYFTSESWQVFAVALSEAQNVYNNEDATQEQVDKAKQNLDVAAKALVRAPVIPPGFTVIRTEDELRAITRRGNYYMANDIVLTRRWTPITRFGGTFDGGGNAIINLEISGTTDQGMFRRLDSGSTVRNLMIQVGPAGVRGTTRVGALAGRADNTTIQGVFIQLGHDGVVGNRYVGGLIGRASNSMITATLVFGHNGPNEFYLEHPEPNDVIAVRADNRTRGTVGGLIGEANRSGVINSASYVNVTGYNQVGGFLGSLRSSTVVNGFSRGLVLGRTTYSRGTYSRGEQVGGFIGISQGRQTRIENSYSTSVVLSNGRRRVNPFIGHVNSALAVTGASFYCRDAAAKSSVSVQDLRNIRGQGEPGAVRVGVIGESRINLMDRETFTTQGANWNFQVVWAVGFLHETPYYVPTLPRFLFVEALKPATEMSLDLEFQD